MDQQCDIPVDDDDVESNVAREPSKRPGPHSVANDSKLPPRLHHLHHRRCP